MQHASVTHTILGAAGAARSHTATKAQAALRLLQVGSLFAVVYAAANQLTSLRGDIGHGVFDWERVIPFVEWTVVPYLSIFVLLPLSFFACRSAEELHLHSRRLLLALALAVACYAAFPLGFHFARPQPQGPFAPLFDLLWTVDLPYNRAPSLHIVVLKLMWPRLTSRITVGWQRAAMHGWLAAIGVSVLTTYQHHVIDIVGGLAVAGACFAFTQRSERRAAFAGAFMSAVGRVGSALASTRTARALGEARPATATGGRFAW